MKLREPLEGAGAPLRLRYLGQRDEAWLAALLDEHGRYFGRKRAELRERLREPLPLRAPKQKLRLATQLLERMVPDLVASSLAPREVRLRAFRAATPRLQPRAAVLAQVAEELGAAASEVEAALLSDLAGERRLGRVPEELSPALLALLVNRALVVRLLRRASLVRLTAWGSTAALVRQARALGLICNVVAGAELGSVRLDVSGPFALFRKTELYGRALASLLPYAARSEQFQLEAHCVLGRGPAKATFLVYGSDPIFPQQDSPLQDDRLEARLARDLSALAKEWRLSLAPPPIPSAGQLLCPELELVHRQDAARRWYVELVGFWTAQYLSQRVAHYRSAGISRVILCVDARRRCSEDELVLQEHIIHYQRRIDARQVLALLERDEPGYSKAVT